MESLVLLGYGLTMINIKIILLKQPLEYILGHHPNIMGILMISHQVNAPVVSQWIGLIWCTQQEMEPRAHLVYPTGKSILNGLLRNAELSSGSA